MLTIIELVAANVALVLYLDWCDRRGTIDLDFTHPPEQEPTMASKEDLCLWCGRFTESRAEDGLADCDRPDCITNRDYTDEPTLKPKVA